jgi:glutathione S-transferase
MSDLIFYTNPQSRGRIVRWMLEELAVPYTTQVVEYGPPMKSAPFIDINPMGKVPAIQHQGRVVTECAAIITYLAEAFPATGLVPPPLQRQDYYRWLFFTAGPLEAALTDKSLGLEITAEQMRRVGYGNYELVLDTLVKALRAKPYIAGDSFTAADVYVGSQLGYALLFKWVPELPEFVAYFDRLKDRPARLRAGELDDALVKPTA